ncbi:hypothetical protein [Mesobacillus subterraneus]|uniref:hypothetical protein n=1 Tax=Mesobacillus subterraneus TaxID=285983 RepID=UPI001CFE6ED1|nr:hypothetical protein [Mesobacillus subterraneus]
MKFTSMRIFLMILMILIFFAHFVSILSTSKYTLFLPLLALVSLFGVVISIMLTYKTKNWLSFIFNALPLYILGVSSFGYSILGSNNFFKVAVTLMIILYLIRLVKIGWKDKN